MVNKNGEPSRTILFQFISFIYAAGGTNLRDMLNPFSPYEILWHFNVSSVYLVEIPETIHVFWVSCLGKKTF